MTQAEPVEKLPDRPQDALEELLALYRDGRFLSWRGIALLAWLVAWGTDAVVDSSAHIVGVDNGEISDIISSLNAAVELAQDGEPPPPMEAVNLAGEGALIKFLIGKLVDALLQRLLSEGGLEAALQFIRELVDRYMEK